MENFIEEIVSGDFVGMILVNEIFWKKKKKKTKFKRMDKRMSVLGRELVKNIKRMVKRY